MKNQILKGQVSLFDVIAVANNAVRAFCIATNEKVYPYDSQMLVNAKWCPVRSTSSILADMHLCYRRHHSKKPRCRKAIVFITIR